jgi:hypothetical protein
MNEWILLVAMLSPGGDFIDKIPVEMPTKAACVQAAKELPKKGETPMGIHYKGICVTADHWTGKKTMKDVPLD